jgi:hypothetical protein
VPNTSNTNARTPSNAITFGSSIRTLFFLRRLPRFPLFHGLADLLGDAVGLTRYDGCAN